MPNIIAVEEPGSAAEVATAFMEYSKLDFHSSLAIILAVSSLDGPNIDLNKIQTRRFTRWIRYSQTGNMCGRLLKYRSELHLTNEIKSKLITENAIVVSSESPLVMKLDVVKEDVVIQYRNIIPHFDCFDPE